MLATFSHDVTGNDSSLEADALGKKPNKSKSGVDTVYHETLINMWGCLSLFLCPPKHVAKNYLKAPGNLSQNTPWKSSSMDTKWNSPISTMLRIKVASSVIKTRDRAENVI